LAAISAFLSSSFSSSVSLSSVLGNSEFVACKGVIFAGLAGTLGFSSVF
jgi:hypothetical protein